MGQPEVRKTPLYKWHVETDAKIVEFAGWLMPLQYRGIVEEHKTVRSTAGLFDISHMGQIDLKGPEAERFLDYLLPNAVCELIPGKILYSVMCNFPGGVIDDLLLYKFKNEHFLLVVNAARTEIDFAWIKEHSQQFPGVEVKNVSEDYAMFALQGPLSAEILKTMTRLDIDEIYYYHFVSGDVAGYPTVVSRTGYTGEDGFEILCQPGAAVTLWNRLLESGKGQGLIPVGLGARDTLRLEMGYPLYGHELDEQTDPWEANLGWTVRLKRKADFVGKRVLEERKSHILKKLIGFVQKDKAIPRNAYKIFNNQNREIGYVTSGSFSPILGTGIGLGYVETGYQEPGTEVLTEIREQLRRAEIVGLPFVDSKVFRKRV